MAFGDSEERRRSIRKGRKGKRVGPIPDGAISSSQDRAHISWLYSNKLYAGAIPKQANRLLLIGVSGC